MGFMKQYLGPRLQRWIAAPIRASIEQQSELIFDAHWTRLLESAPYNASLRLERFGFRTYSQNDEDGIIQEILARVGAPNSTFVEFGVEDGRQSNSTLLLYKGWRGLWIECSDKHYVGITEHFGTQLQSGQLQLAREFVDAENINRLVAQAGLGEIDCLSIDIDGNDYWVWKAIEARPRVAILEYNGKFRPPMRWVMEYNPAHRWDGSDYQGASLQSLADLGREKGYTLVGCSLAGVNAFFVRDDLVQDRFSKDDVERLYNPPRYYAGRYLLTGHRKMGRGPFKSS